MACQYALEPGKIVISNHNSLRMKQRERMYKRVYSAPSEYLNEVLLDGKSEAHLVGTSERKDSCAYCSERLICAPVITTWKHRFPAG